MGDPAAEAEQFFAEFRALAAEHESVPAMLERPDLPKDMALEPTFLKLNREADDLLAFRLNDEGGNPRVAFLITQADLDTALRDR